MHIYQVAPNLARARAEGWEVAGSKPVLLNDGRVYFLVTKINPDDVSWCFVGYVPVAGKAEPVVQTS